MRRGDLPKQRSGPAPETPARTAPPQLPYVYIVTCADGTYYTGYTTDPGRRLRQHNSGTASKFTRGRRPVRLSFLEREESRGAALRREHEIKKLSREQKSALCKEYRASRQSIR